MPPLAALLARQPKDYKLEKYVVEDILRTLNHYQDTLAWKCPTGFFRTVGGGGFTAGLTKGGSDIVVCHGYIIRPEDVGKMVAEFSVIEAKRWDNKPTEEQELFIDNVLKCGGKAGVAMCPADAVKILGTRGLAKEYL